MNLSVSTAWQDHVATVTLSGELDLGSRDIVDRAIGQAIGAEATAAVVVDLSGLGFLDSSGVNLLVKGRREAEQAGVSFRVDGATDMVRQVLSLTGVLEHLSGERG
jgi:anti-sigma B factor antagonist